ncbi:Uncharacterized protein GNX_0587 [Leptospira interrogans serovar Canicola]|nr:Uncharacterized protein A9P81_1622 [Leptospira interrogans serovar Copenhageni/Icterohaemorrhagiae]OCC30845.1 Uncharacterized protein GNX_0587 [Leptospira interrogans serovar Canicola]SIQ12107.1 hypothetical protein SAMN05421689_104105 [Leptospira interrogans]
MTKLGSKRRKRSTQSMLVIRSLLIERRSDKGKGTIVTRSDSRFRNIFLASSSKLKTEGSTIAFFYFAAYIEYKPTLAPMSQKYRIFRYLINPF